MSTRTILEINHDPLKNWQGNPSEAGLTIYRALCGVERNFDFELEHFGIRLLVQRHHSTKVTVEVE